MTGITDIFWAILTWLTAFLPAVMILLPFVSGYGRLPIVWTRVLALGGITLFCIIGGILEGALAIYVPNFLLFVLLLIVCLLYFRLDRWKTLYLFVNASALVSFGFMLNDVTEARLNPNGQTEGLTHWGLLIQLLVGIFSVSLSFLLKKRVIWLLEHNDSRTLWRTIWLVPFAILIVNLYIDPRDYHTMAVGRLFAISFAIEGIMAFFLGAFNFLLYFFAQSAYETFQLRSETELYQLEISYFEALREHIKETDRLRHDFRHIRRAVLELVHQEKYGELSSLLTEYYDSAPFFHENILYCRSDAVNALLNHYHERAAERDISCTFRISISGKTGISDVDLSVILGNLLDNAIHGCESVTAKNVPRFIRLQVDTDTPGSLYITVCNTFDPSSPKKESREGIGLRSIALTAKKYDGETKFTVSGNHYLSNVMLRLPPPS